LIPVCYNLHCPDTNYFGWWVLLKESTYPLTADVDVVLKISPLACDACIASVFALRFVSVNISLSSLSITSILFSKDIWVPLHAKNCSFNYESVILTENSFFEILVSFMCNSSTCECILSHTSEASLTIQLSTLCRTLIRSLISSRAIHWRCIWLPTGTISLSTFGNSLSVYSCQHTIINYSNLISFLITSISILYFSIICFLCLDDWGCSSCRTFRCWFWIATSPIPCLASSGSSCSFSKSYRFELMEDKCHYTGIMTACLGIMWPISVCLASGLSLSSGWLDGCNMLVSLVGVWLWRVIKG